MPAPEVIDGISSGLGPGRLPHIRGCITAGRSRDPDQAGVRLVGVNRVSVKVTGPSVSTINCVIDVDKTPC